MVKLTNTSAKAIINLLIILFYSAILAQNNVPHTSTFPGVENSYFEYVNPEEAGLSDQSLQQLSTDILQWVDDGELVGAELLIIKDDKVVFHEAFGWADKEEERALKRNSIWNIKSMTKPFVSAAILMLIEDEKLNLQDPVKKYIPGYSNDSTTIFNLLTHSSGYSGLGYTKNFKDIGAWVKDWAKEKPARPLGQYSYSDFNYAALGYIIGVISGKKAENFIQDEIIEPLNLKNTYTSFSPDFEWAGRVNSRYEYSDSSKTYVKYWKNNDNQEYVFFPAAWGIFSTALDYAKFMELWLEKGKINGKQILERETILSALKPQVRFGPFSHGYGYGWVINEYKDKDKMPFSFSHTGYDGTIGISFPHSNAMVVYQSHSRGRNHRSLIWNKLDMLNIFKEKGPYTPILSWPPPDFSSVKVDTNKLREYEGVYQGIQPWDQSEIIFKISVSDNTLLLKMAPVDENTFMTMNLIPTDDDEFIMGKLRDGQVESIGTDSFLFLKEIDGTTGFEIIYEGEPVMSANRISK